MTPEEYRDAIQKLKLTQHGAADWLRIGRRTSQGYALGETPIPEPTAMLLRLCIKRRIKPKFVT